MALRDAVLADMMDANGLDALIAAETGLVKRVQEKQTWYGQALREMFSLVALAQGIDAKAKAVQGGRLLWADAESRSQSQLADALLKLKQIGFPFRWLALRYGLTPTEVAEVIAMREEEAAMDPMAALMTGHRPGDGESEPEGEPGDGGEG
jgi:hypothetical protein